jgi:hypothetical protein
MSVIVLLLSNLVSSHLEHLSQVGAMSDAFRSAAATAAAACGRWPHSRGVRVDCAARRARGAHAPPGWARARRSASP